ncbi:MAG: glycosyltransferase [Candidatus Aminicenantes bacterium]|nr:MAG: glycosyltransferase [Candidatus Aminicenantes bacterium]
MTKKNILVVCPGHFYPITMGSQIRMYELVKGLSKYHRVDVIAKVPSKIHLSGEYFQKIKDICTQYYPIQAPNKENLFKKAYYRIKCEFIKPGSMPDNLFYYSIKKLQRKILQIANRKKYDIITCEYWFSCFFYNELTYRPYFVLDTIDVNFGKYESGLKNKKNCRKNRKKLEKYKEFELKYTSLNDLIISVSENDYLFFKKTFPGKDHLKIPIGQDLTHYISYNSIYEDSKKKILFYGNMGSEQNIKAFFRLYDHILPKIKSKIPGTELIVLGAYPPGKIRELHNGKDIFVTGFVKDTREWIAKASLMILPMEIAGGFRTRVVEVMAMGVPVIGTHNALDCLEMDNGMHGFVTDSNEEMANYAVKLLNDFEFRNQMASKCKKFVTEKYSIEATYGKLSKYFLER